MSSLKIGDTVKFNTVFKKSTDIYVVVKVDNDDIFLLPHSLSNTDFSFSHPVHFSLLEKFIEPVKPIPTNVMARDNMLGDV